MVDDRLPSAGAAAFDASVYTNDRTATSQRETKTASAVDYYTRELANAEEGLKLQRQKVEKQKGHLESAELSLEEAQAERDRLRDALDSAQEQLSEMVNTEVAP